LHVSGHGTDVMININRKANAAKVVQAEQPARVALAHLK
jgi:hypothetical protein